MYHLYYLVKNYWNTYHTLNSKLNLISNEMDQWQKRGLSPFRHAVQANRNAKEIGEHFEKMQAAYEECKVSSTSLDLMSPETDNNWCCLITRLKCCSKLREMLVQSRMTPVSSKIIPVNEFLICGRYVD